MKTAKTSNKRLAIATLSPLALMLAGAPMAAMATPTSGINTGTSAPALYAQLKVNRSLTALSSMAATNDAHPAVVKCTSGYSSTKKCLIWEIGCTTTTKCSSGYSSTNAIALPPSTALTANARLAVAPSPFDAFKPTV